jgi:hypothetical protein
LLYFGQVLSDELIKRFQKSQSKGVFDACFGGTHAGPRILGVIGHTRYSPNILTLPRVRHPRRHSIVAFLFFILLCYRRPAPAFCLSVCARRVGECHIAARLALNRYPTSSRTTEPELHPHVWTPHHLASNLWFSDRDSQPTGGSHGNGGDSSDDAPALPTLPAQQPTLRGIFLSHNGARVFGKFVGTVCIGLCSVCGERTSQQAAAHAELPLLSDDTYTSTFARTASTCCMC